jgi:zinc and cadmium transporter
MLLTILLFTFLGSVLSLIGGALLLFSKKVVLKISHLLISFAAGTLLGTAFFDLLPEAMDELNYSSVLLFTLIGILSFFLLERFVHWFHHHGHEGGIELDHMEPTVPLIIIGDTVHNFIDGVVIAATFLVNAPIGIITAIAVAAHEIPQEIGDFAILLHKGMEKKKVFLINLLSALSAIIGAVLTFFLKDYIEGLLPIFISITAGFFIYIASSDLIPEIHHEKRKGFALYETLLLFLGVVLVYVLVGLLE